MIKTEYYNRTGQASAFKWALYQPMRLFLPSVQFCLREMIVSINYVKSNLTVNEWDKPFSPYERLTNGQAVGSKIKKNHLQVMWKKSLLKSTTVHFFTLSLLLVHPACNPVWWRNICITYCERSTRVCANASLWHTGL